jgi:hypothetical protein
MEVIDINKDRTYIWTQSGPIIYDELDSIFGNLHFQGDPYGPKIIVLGVLLSRSKYAQYSTVHH